VKSIFGILHFYRDSATAILVFRFILCNLSDWLRRLVCHFSDGLLSRVGLERTHHMPSSLQFAFKL
jgi:hypothetical protein